MGILATAKPAIVMCTRDRSRATAFYRDVLGLTLAFEDDFADVFNTGGITLRLSSVPDFVPHEHAIVGFNVARRASHREGSQGKGRHLQSLSAFHTGRIRYLDDAQRQGSSGMFQGPRRQRVQRDQRVTASDSNARAFR